MTLEAARKWKAKRWSEILAMPKIPCACGCGELIPPLTKQFKPAIYKQGHMFHVYRPRNPGGKGKGRVKDIPLTESEKVKRYMEKEWQKVLLMPKIPCACGCGELIPPFTKQLKPAQFALGHNSRVETASNAEGRFKANHPTWNKGIKGESSHSFIDGSSRFPYPLEFDHGLKEFIRSRDNYICQHCGITQDELGFTIYVHHLDHNKDNLDCENLVACCPKCNQWASRNREKPFINSQIWDATHG